MSKTRDYSVKYSSISNEHFTPPSVVEKVRDLYDGTIDLDPCSCAIANSLVKANEYMTDFTSASWHGNILINPFGGMYDVPEAITANPLMGKLGGYESAAKVLWRYTWMQWLKGNIKSAVFVGFSISIARLAQPTTKELEAGIFNDGDMSLSKIPFCIPRDRLKFWVHGEDEAHQKAFKVKAAKTFSKEQKSSPDYEQRLQQRADNLRDQWQDKKKSSLDGNAECHVDEFGLEHWFYESDSPPNDSLLIFLPDRDYWYHSCKKFEETFSDFGTIVNPGITKNGHIPKTFQDYDDVPW